MYVYGGVIQSRHVDSRVYVYFGVTFIGDSCLPKLSSHQQTSRFHSRPHSLSLAVMEVRFIDSNKNFTIFHRLSISETLIAY